MVSAGARWICDRKAMPRIVYLGVTLLLSAAATIACWIPARRATRVDPMVVLRNE